MVSDSSRDSPEKQKSSDICIWNILKLVSNRSTLQKQLIIPVIDVHSMAWAWTLTDRRASKAAPEPRPRRRDKAKTLKPSEVVEYERTRANVASFLGDLKTNQVLKVFQNQQGL